MDVALPLCASGFGRPDHWWLAVMGRLKSGWTAEQANAHLSAIAPELLRQVVPPNYDAEGARQLTTLKLSVRATSRQPELALRLALGASTTRIVRQLLIEGLLIGIAGTAIGLAIARLAGTGVVALLSTRTDPIVLDLASDWRGLVFRAAIVALTTLAFALAPAVQAAWMARLATTTPRATASRESSALRDVLVGLQVAMSVVLVSAAILFLMTFRNLASMDLGFGTREVLVANVFMNEERYEGKTRAARERLTARLAAIPGVAAIAHASTPPSGESRGERSSACKVPRASSRVRRIATRSLAGTSG